MTYASAVDVETRLMRSLTDAEANAVPAILDDVEQMVLDRIPDLHDQVVALPPTIAAETVASVEAWTVARFLRNPDGKYQESIDDYSFTRDQAISSGELAISESDWRRLLPATSWRTRSIRTVAYGDV